MKLKLKASAVLLTLAGGAFIVPAARATTLNTYNEGDLLLGFNQLFVQASTQANPYTTSSYVVDIGSAATFFDATPGSSFVVSGLGQTLGDLNSLFGSNWNTDINTLNWGIAGATDKNVSITLGGVSLPADTLFFTEAETIPGTQSTPLLASSLHTQKGYVAAFDAFSGNGSFTNTPETENGTPATIQASGGSSWAANDPGTDAFGSGFNIEQQTGQGPTTSVLDLYELQPGNGAEGTYIGDFTLNTGGQLTFTAAVPEPASAGMLVLGIGFLGLLRRPRRSSPV